MHSQGHRERTPDAVRGASGLAARTGWFPLGYREGFSQWVCQKPGRYKTVVVALC